MKVSRIWVGTITKPVGLQGMVKVKSQSDFVAERFKKGRQLFLEDGSSLIVKSASFSGLFGRLSFEGYHHLEDVEGLRNQKLFVDSSQTVDLKPDEYHFNDLLGCQVVNQKGEDLGQVLEVMDYPRGQILRVGDHGQSFLLPFHHVFVKDVDIERQRITIEEIDNLR